MANRSREQRLLDDHPELRQRVSQVDDFIRWRATFSEPSIEGKLSQTAPAPRGALAASHLFKEWGRD